MDEYNASVKADKLKTSNVLSRLTAKKVEPVKKEKEEVVAKEKMEEEEEEQKDEDQ